MEFGPFSPSTLAIFVGYIVSGLSFVWALRAELRVLKNDMGHVKSEMRMMSEAFSKLGDILTKVAVQDVRIVTIEKRIDELAHGRGFVRDE